MPMDNKQSKILIVDDEPDIVEALRHFLEGRGHRVLTALSGEDALSRLKEEAVDLALLDVMLPGIKGTDVAQAIRELYPKTKVIIVTAYPEAAQGLYNNKVLEGLLVKPVGVEQLYKKMLEVLAFDDQPGVADKQQAGIKARVIVIKAKLLIVESHKAVFDSIASCLRQAGKRGELYEVFYARDYQEAAGALVESRPDMLVVNSGSLTRQERELIDKISISDGAPKEIIVYEPPLGGGLGQQELEKIAGTIQSLSLKNGFIDFHWVSL